MTELIEAVIARLREKRPHWSEAVWDDIYWASEIDADLSRLLDYVEGVSAGPHWFPISEARAQSTYLVGSSEFSGWFAIASLSALKEWHIEGGQDRLPHAPTHFAYLLPPTAIKRNP